MRLLFAITVGCLCATLCVIVLVAQSLRRRRSLTARPARRHGTPEFFDTGEFRTPRPLPLALNQEILKQRPRLSLAEITFPPEIHAPASTARGIRQEPIASKQSSSVIFDKATGRIVRIDSRPQPVAPARTEPPVQAKQSAAPSPSAFSGNRIPPRSDNGSGQQSRFAPSNTSAGGSDTQQNHSLRGSGTLGPIPAVLEGRR